MKKLETPPSELTLKHKMLVDHCVIDHKSYRIAKRFQASGFEAKAKLNIICQKKIREWSQFL